MSYGAELILLLIGGMQLYYVRRSNACFMSEKIKENGILWDSSNCLQDYDNLVFQDNATIESFLKAATVLDKKIFCISLSGCGSTDVFRDLLKMKADGLVEEIVISPDVLFKALDYPDLWIGAESWSKANNDGRLVPLDYAFSNGKMIAFTVGNARNLLNQADEVIDWIENSSPESELDKVLLLDLWFQKNIQYIKGRESIAGGKTYVCEEISRESQTEDVLLSHFGVCADIAFTACLILNHPRMNIYCRQIHSEEQQHSWNVIKLNEKEFYTDFTHNITRNPYRLSETLMTTAYCCDNTLLGKTEACVKYGVPSDYTGIDLSDISYSRVDINNCLQRFRIGGINLTWNPIPVKKQHLQPEQK